jgi:hypothetical protein
LMPIVQVYDSSNKMIIPGEIILTNANTTTVTFPTAQTGKVVVVNGDGNVNGTSGTSGANGTSGTSGFGVPTGGTSGQILVKNSSTSGDASWKSLAYAAITMSTIPAASNQDITPVLANGDGITVSGNTIIIANPGVYLVNASIAIRATYAEYAWVDASNNRLTGTTTGLSISANSTDPAGPANAMGIVNITSANTVIKLRIYVGAGFSLTQNTAYAAATITQLK